MALPPLKGFERHRCGGRHGGPWGRDKANWRFVKGPKSQGHYPSAHAVCRACGIAVKGVAAEHFPAELAAATGKSRTYQTKHPGYTKRVRTDSQPEARRHKGVQAARATRRRATVERHHLAKKGRRAR